MQMYGVRIQAERYMGLDIHKHYLVATGVDREQERVYGPKRVPKAQIPDWIGKELRPNDAVVLEMTTNTWEMVDLLEGWAGTVTVVHPPHVHLITRAQVMTDAKASLVLAQLHAAGLLPAVWIPPQPVRDLRALVAQRQKMVRLATQAKNRLQSLLHRRHLSPPVGMALFGKEAQDWWTSLPLSIIEQVRIQSDLDTLHYAQKQVRTIEAHLAEIAVQDGRVMLLVQLPGVNLVTAMSLLASIGDIRRFENASKLVGYAGLGARIHDSGEATLRGRITKSGRKDLRWAMVEIARSAVRTHPHWQAEYERLSPRLGKKKAVVAISRKILVCVWHVLTYEKVDKHFDEVRVAASYFAFAYKVGIGNLPDGMSARQYVRHCLDELGIGQNLSSFKWGGKRVNLPPSRFAERA